MSSSVSYTHPYATVESTSITGNSICFLCGNDVFNCRCESYPITVYAEDEVALPKKEKRRRKGQNSNDWDRR